MGLDKLPGILYNVTMRLADSNDIARLNDKIAQAGPNECWPWIGAKDRDGYGRIKFRGVSARASRLILATIRDVPPAAKVRHTCDNPSCCNPRHLRLGTHLQNMRDMVARRRGRSGSRLRAKLTVESARELRSLRGSMSQPQAAARFGVSRGTVSSVWNHKTWRDV